MAYLVPGKEAVGFLCGNPAESRMATSYHTVWG